MGPALFHLANDSEKVWGFNIADWTLPEIGEHVFKQVTLLSVKVSVTPSVLFDG